MSLRVRWQIVEDDKLIASGDIVAHGDGAYETAMRAAEAIERALLAFAPGAAVPPPEALGVRRSGAVQ